MTPTVLDRALEQKAERVRGRVRWLAAWFGAAGLAAAIVAVAARRRQGAAKDLEIIDLTSRTPADKRHDRQGAQITGVVIHQMGFSRGNDPSRYLGVTAHFIVLPDGTVAKLHPVRYKLWASQEFNSRSISVEFAGNLQNVRGEWWNPDKMGTNVLTEAQIAAGRKLVRYLRDQYGITYIWTHIQSQGWERANDPGPEIWSTVGEYALATLGLSDGGPGYIEKGGLPIPQAWRVYDLDQRTVPT